MDTHELARILVEGPKREIVASVDVSTCDEDGGRRGFADEFLGIQWEPDGTVTFIFSGGYDNGESE